LGTSNDGDDEMNHPQSNAASQLIDGHQNGDTNEAKKVSETRFIPDPAGLLISVFALSFIVR
jgi:hypothetical protein